MLLFIFFFFSSRRRHTRYWRDWSSDVCSSDLRPYPARGGPAQRPGRRAASRSSPCRTARRSEERRVGKGVDLGGRRIIKKKKKNKKKKKEKTNVNKKYKR